MYLQDLRTSYSGASPFIWHNHLAHSSIIDLLAAWDVECANVFRPGSYYQSTQLLAPAPRGFFDSHDSRHAFSMQRI
jgi:hypothetical protein